LQDRYAQRREGRDGFVSGPFQCWSYLVPGEYVKMWDRTYLPTKFKCMQVGVTWSPDMSTSVYLEEDDRDEVVFQCQKRCRNTEGCRHFTVMFPGLCRMAGESSVPLPAEGAISGPPQPDCLTDLNSEAPLGHTFMRKFSSGEKWEASDSPPLRGTLVAPATLAAGGLVAMLVWWRRRPGGELAPPRMVAVDLEDLLEGTAQE